MTKFVCSVCGSSYVQVRAWVDPNIETVKNEEMEFDPNESEDCWCQDCEDHNSLVTEEEFQAESAASEDDPEEDE